MAFNSCYNISPCMKEVQIDDPETFQFASVVVKTSKSGFSSNRRLLVVKGGHIFYYSNVPKQFDGDVKVLEFFHELPKSSIEVIKIKKIRTTSMAALDFSITFSACHMLEREDIRQSLTNQNYAFTPRGDKEDVEWTFECDNQYIKQNWISILAQLIGHFVNEDQAIQKYFENLDPTHAAEMKAFEGGRMSRNPWRDSAASRKSYLNAHKELIEREESKSEIANSFRKPMESVS